MSEKMRNDQIIRAAQEAGLWPDHNDVKERFVDGTELKESIIKFASAISQASPSAQAIETAAIMRAEDCVIRTFNELQFKDSDTQLCVKAALGDVRVRLQALIPQNGRTALEEFGMKVAGAAWAKGRMNSELSDCEPIVTNLIGVQPLNSETVSGEGE